MGVVVQSQMEALEEDHPTDTCDCEIGSVIVVTEIKRANGQDEVRFRSSAGTGPIKTLQLALGVATTIAAGPHE
jgi:hypothetical protein